MQADKGGHHGHVAVLFTLLYGVWLENVFSVARCGVVDLHVHSNLELTEIVLSASASARGSA